MNEHAKELCHWGLSLGEKKQGHKYLVRVEGKRPGSYIYFYDLDKYNRWKQGAKTKLENTGNKLKTKVQNEAKKASKKISEIGKMTNSAAKRIAARTIQEKTKAQAAVQKYAERIPASVKNESQKMQNKIDAGKKALLRDASESVKKTTHSVKDISKNVIDTGKNAVVTTKKSISKEISSVDNKVHEKIDSMFNDIKNVKISGTKQSKSLVSKVSSLISNFAKAYVRTLGNMAYSIIGKKKSDQAPTIQPNTKKDGSYIASVTYPDGRTVKITNKDDWQRYAEVFRYQNNEQEFMHSVPEVQLRDDGTMPTEKEDKAEVNEKIGKGQFRTVNCIFCSTAYELRRRGYDVEAPDLASDVNAMSISKLYDVKDSQMNRGTRTFDVYEDENEPVSSTYAKAKLNRIKKVDGKTVKEYTIDYYDLKNNDPHIKSFTPAKDFDLSLDKGTQDWTKEAISAMRKATESFPNNSRGMVNVYWSVGGGHSIVWEKDENGKMSFYDTQVNKPVEYSTIIKDIDIGAPMQFVRTDDLKLNQSVLQRVKSN